MKRRRSSESGELADHAPVDGRVRQELSADRWREIFEAADRVLAMPLDERAAFLARYATEQPALAGEVEALLAGAEAPSPLDGPAAAFATPLVDHVVRHQDAEPSESWFGPYRLLREIGRGGMGAVYLAERSDDQYDKRVALKLLPAWSAGDHRRVQRFVDERQILAALDHPDIARLVDGGVTSEGLPWFALEFVDGVPIDRYCDEHALSIADRLKLFCQICGAVQYAHRNLVVHCDLKPANILVTAEGRVRLLDFGIAKMLGGHATPVDGAAAVEGDRILTPLYASPEQIRGEPVTTASDVYALGVLLNLLLTGRSPYPFAGGDRHDFARAVLEQSALRPSAAAPPGGDSPGEQVAATRATTPRGLRLRLEGDLDAIVLKALEKEPSRRYTTAQQLEADVRRHLDGLPIVALPGSRLDHARKFVRRHRVGVAMATALASLVVAFAITMTVQTVRIRAQARRIALERDRAEQVSLFLRRMFATADRSALRQGITAQGILDSAAARIDGTLFPDPAERARLMFDMAKAYHRLGFPARARPLLERSLALRRDARPTLDVEIAETSQLLGTVLLEQGEPVAAERAYLEALALRRRALGSRHADVARSLVGMSAASRARRRLPAAERFAREAMAIDRDHPADLAQSTGALAGVLLDRGDHREATRLFRRALALARQTHPEEHVEVASAVFDLAAALKASGDHAAGDSLVSYGLALHQRVLLSPALPAGAGVALPAIARGPEAAVPASASPSAATQPNDAAAAAGRTSALDDAQILFTSDRDAPDANGDLGAPALYVMAVDGSGQRRLTHDNAPASFPSWSSDGKQIAFGTMRDGQANVIVMNADGTGQRRLTDPSKHGVGAQRPTWSPDGRRIAFQSMLRPDIYVIGVDGAGLVNITHHPAQDVFPAWSPDGRRIAFVSDRDGNKEIYVMNADGRSVVRLTVNEQTDQRPAWSPDGRRIAFQSERDGDQEIYVMNADGSNQVRLTTNPGDDAGASWSPDGRQIVFHRRVFGHGQVYVMNADGSGVRRLTEPSGDAFNGFPSWRPRR